MPRYAVLAHDWPTPHFDLLIEAEEKGEKGSGPFFGFGKNGPDPFSSACLTWRLSTWPPFDGMPVERIADHRPLYLDYDGPVSGDRGTVTTVERGTFEWVSHGDHFFDLTPIFSSQSWDETMDRIRKVRIASGTLFLPGDR